MLDGDNYACVACRKPGAARKPLARKVVIVPAASGAAAGSLTSGRRTAFTRPFLHVSHSSGGGASPGCKPGSGSGPKKAATPSKRKAASARPKAAAAASSPPAPPLRIVLPPTGLPVVAHAPPPPLALASLPPSKRRRVTASRKASEAAAQAQAEAEAAADAPPPPARPPPRSSATPPSVFVTPLRPQRRRRHSLLTARFVHHPGVAVMAAAQALLPGCASGSCSLGSPASPPPTKLSADGSPSSSPEMSALHLLVAASLRSSPNTPRAAALAVVDAAHERCRSRAASSAGWSVEQRSEALRRAWAAATAARAGAASAQSQCGLPAAPPPSLLRPTALRPRRPSPPSAGAGAAQPRSEDLAALAAALASAGAEADGARDGGPQDAVARCRVVLNYCRFLSASQASLASSGLAGAVGALRSHSDEVVAAAAASLCLSPTWQAAVQDSGCARCRHSKDGCPRCRFVGERTAKARKRMLPSPGVASSFAPSAFEAALPVQNSPLGSLNPQCCFHAGLQCFRDIGPDELLIGGSPAALGWQDEQMLSAMGLTLAALSPRSQPLIATGVPISCPVAQPVSPATGANYLNIPSPTFAHSGADVGLMLPPPPRQGGLATQLWGRLEYEEAGAPADFVYGQA